jgi:hypothetical protein
MLLTVLKINVDQHRSTMRMVARSTVATAPLTGRVPLNALNAPRPAFKAFH